MTKEELKQEAEEYLKKHNYTSGYIGYFASGYCEQAYIDSAEPREKRIAELEAQIEKMKCGGNCKFEYWKNTGGCYDQKCRFTGLDCTNCEDKWKGKWEND